LPIWLEISITPGNVGDMFMFVRYKYTSQILIKVKLKFIKNEGNPFNLYNTLKDEVQKSDDLMEIRVLFCE